MQPDHVETQSTSVPHFDEAEPHPSSPAGQVQMWGTFARRLGPTTIRVLLLVGLAGVVALLIAEVV